MGEKRIVSVLMSVYAEPVEYLVEAIESILTQSFTNFEFIVILDNPSNEELWNVLLKFKEKDQRIILLKNERNIGLAATLNRGHVLAKGDYVVRMDADDISIPSRIEKLVEYMEGNPTIGVCGSWMKAFGGKKRYENRIVRYSSKHDDLEVSALYVTPIGHAPSIIRRKIIDKYTPLYNEKCCRTQDYELWSRLINSGVIFSNISETLYLRRASNGAGPQPIPYQFIHNQISRNNIQFFLSKYSIKLPDKVTYKDILAVRNILHVIDINKDKRKAQTILLLMYLSIYKSPFIRIYHIIFNGDIFKIRKVSNKILLRLFFYTNILFDINKQYTDSEMSIY